MKEYPPAGENPLILKFHEKKREEKTIPWGRLFFLYFVPHFIFYF